MTKKDFLDSYAAAELRITLKKAQQAHSACKDLVAAEIKELEAVRAAVMRTIETAPEPTMRVIIEARHINGMNWRQIAHMTGYCVRNAQYIYDNAINAMKYPAYVT